MGIPQIYANFFQISGGLEGSFLRDVLRKVSKNALLMRKALHIQRKSKEKGSTESGPKQFPVTIYRLMPMAALS
jgi:hypothetical protein